MPLTNRIREWRAENDMSINEAADLAGFSQAYFSLLERGLRNASPRARVLISRRLGARVAELFPVDPGS